MKRKLCKTMFVSLLIISLTLFSQAWAEETGDESKKLDDVVVSATRTEKKVDDAPAKVTVITKEDIQKNNIKTLDEALRHEVGVYAKRSSALSESTAKVTMRGFAGQDQTLILLDGVPVNEGYFGGVNWDTYSVKNVERIEITRGGGSALYGGNAMGGVINIITQKPDKLEAGIYGGYGSDTTYKYGAYVGDKYNQFSMRVGYEAEQTDGYPNKLVSRSISDGSGTLTGGYEITDANDSSKWICGDTGDRESDRSNVDVMLGYDVTDTGMLTFNFQHGISHYDYDEPNTYLTDASGAESFDGSVDIPGDRYASVTPYRYLSGIGGIENYAASLIYKDVLGDIGVNSKFGFQNDEKWYTSPQSGGTYDDATGTASFYGTLTFTADIQADIPIGDKHLLTTGVYFRSDDFDLDTYNLAFYRNEDSKLDKTIVTQGKDQLYAIYLQEEWNVIDQLTIYGGARLDYWKAYDGVSGSVGAEEEADESDDSAISPQVAAVWNPRSGTYVRCSAAKAFRAPNIYELFRTWTTSMGYTYHGNPDLEPESTWTYEAGVDQYLLDRKMKLSATYFYTQAKDLIGSKKEGDTDYYYQNIGEADIQGVELEASVTPLTWLNVWANYTNTDSEVKKNEKDPTTVGKYLADYPLSTFNTGCDLTYKWFRVSLSGDYLGRIYTSEQNDDLADAYLGYSERWLWDAKLICTPVKYAEFSISVENVFDEEYYAYSIGRERSYFFEACFKY